MNQDHFIENPNIYIYACIYTYMTKIISISDTAYEELKKIKNGNSFTEVILKLTNEKKKCSIMEFAGILSEKEGDEMLKKIYEERKIGSRRFQ
jgi:predicted CopG family antitoxin